MRIPPILGTLVGFEVVRLFAKNWLPDTSDDGQKNKFLRTTFLGLQLQKGDLRWPTNPIQTPNPFKHTLTKNFINLHTINYLLTYTNDPSTQ